MFSVFFVTPLQTERRDCSGRDRMKPSTTHTSFNVPERINDDALTPIDLDDLGRTVWRTAVVDESRNTTALRSVNHRILIDTEKVTTADSALEIPALAHVRHLLPYLFTDVLNDHIISSDILLGV